MITELNRERCEFFIPANDVPSFAVVGYNLWYDSSAIFSSRKIPNRLEKKSPRQSENSIAYTVIFTCTSDAITWTEYFFSPSGYKESVSRRRPQGGVVKNAPCVRVGD